MNKIHKHRLSKIRSDKKLSESKIKREAIEKNNQARARYREYGVITPGIAFYSSQT